MCTLVSPRILALRNLIAVQAAERQSILCRYANNWATKAFMQIYLKNHRQHMRRCDSRAEADQGGAEGSSRDAVEDDEELGGSSDDK